jgi:3-dehydroquinate synthase
VQERIRDLVKRAGLPTEMPGHSPAALIRAMRQDKKVKDGQMHFVLPTRIGHVMIKPVNESVLRSFLRETR